MAGFLGEWDKHRPVEISASFLHLDWHQENQGFSHKGCEVRNISIPSGIPHIPRLSDY